MGNRGVVGPSGPLVHGGNLIAQQAVDAKLLLGEEHLLRLRRLVPVEGVVESLLVGRIPFDKRRRSTRRHPRHSPPWLHHPIHHRHPAGRAAPLSLTPAFGELLVGIDHCRVGPHPGRKLLRQLAHRRFVALEELTRQFLAGLETGKALEEVGAEFGGPGLEIGLAVPEPLPFGERLALHTSSALVDIGRPGVVGVRGDPVDLLERRDLAVDLLPLRGDLRRELAVGHEQRRQDQRRHQRRKEPEVVLREEVPVRSDGVRDHGHGFPLALA